MFMVNSNNIIVLIKMNIRIFHKIVDAKTKGRYNEIAMKYTGISKNQKGGEDHEDNQIRRVGNFYPWA